MFCPHNAVCLILPDACLEVSVKRLLTGVFATQVINLAKPSYTMG